MPIPLPNPLPLFAFALSALAAPSIAMADAQLDKALAGTPVGYQQGARSVPPSERDTCVFGVKPDSVVVEITPGGGWYTEVLGPYLRDKGRYYAASTERGLKGLKERMAKTQTCSTRLGTLTFALDKVEFRPEGGADVVLTFRNVHNWLMGTISRTKFSRPPSMP